MVYGMAQRHGARLEIDSKPGSGTLVRLIFPARTEGAGTAAPAPAVRTRELRILLINGNDSLLQSLGTVLRDEGHQVTAVRDNAAGREALHRALAAMESIDLVMVDRLPRVNEFVAYAREQIPSVRIILLGAWNGDRHPSAAKNDVAVDRVLNYPPRLAELRAALADLAPRSAST